MSILWFVIAASVVGNVIALWKLAGWVRRVSERVWWLEQHAQKRPY